MKKYFILIIGLFFFISLQSQTLFERLPLDHIWLLGDNNIRLDFNYSPPSINLENRIIDLDFTNASICNENGELLFYTNGIRVQNDFQQYLQNGYRINPGPISEFWQNGGNKIVQGAIALSHVNSNNLYDLIYAEKITTTLEDGRVVNMNRRIHHALIDMNENDGQGRVIEKDFPLLLDTLDVGKITACRHGNGRDWWIIVPYFDANEYHRFLLDNEGILDFGIVRAGDGMRWGLGQAVFSPDGTKYVNFSTVSISAGQFLSIYDFDRCTGLLNNQRLLMYNDTAFAGGVAISENGRFLYTSSYTNLYQTDLESENIEESFELIAEYDGYWEDVSSLTTTFFMAQITPDGRIFINSPNSAKKLHSIEHPNKRGNASDFQQHSITLPAWNQLTLPNYPYYGLGPWDGSPCDTLNINNPAPEAAFEYTPDSLEQTVEFFDASHYAYEWLWDFGDGSELDTLHHPVHTYAQPGTYEVCLTVSNVTGVDTYCDTLYLDVTPTNDVFSTDMKVTISPNPVRDVAVVRLEGFESLNSETLQFSLTDASGRRFFLQSLSRTCFGKVRRQQGQITLKLNLSDYPNGLYYLQLYDKKGNSHSQKIIITH